MHLNHLNLVTPDVAALAAFFRRFFGFELAAMRGADAFALLRGADGFTLSLMKPGKAEQAAYPENFHVGFFVETPESVRAKHAELSEAGLAPGEVQELGRAGSVMTTFYCKAPGGLLVEVASTAEG